MRGFLNEKASRIDEKHLHLDSYWVSYIMYVNIGYDDKKTFFLLSTFPWNLLRCFQKEQGMEIFLVIITCT